MQMKYDCFLQSLSVHHYFSRLIRGLQFLARMCHYHLEAAACHYTAGPLRRYENGIGLFTMLFQSDGYKVDSNPRPLERETSTLTTRPPRRPVDCVVF